MSEERMKILTMLSDGKISAEEADKLLAVVYENKTAEESETVEGLPRYFYVNVKSEGEKREDVNIKVPIALVKAGVNIASLMPDDVQGEINKTMGEKGLKFNLSDIKKENLDDFIQALRELEVNVDSENERVRIYCS